MANKFFLGLSSLLLPLGFYVGPANSSASYQRSYLSASRGATQHLLDVPTSSAKIAREFVVADEGELQILETNPIHELVIIDAAVPDKQQFYRAVKPGVDIVEINSSEDGLIQLNKVLANYKNLAAVHIVSHAQAGSMLLGNSQITAESLKTEIETFAALNGAVKEGGDLLLYGCDLASNEKGEELLDIIQHNTHLDVAASNDLTGNIQQHGDWELEVKRGNIESALAFSEKSLKDFSSVLSTFTLSGFAYHAPSSTSDCPSDAGSGYQYSSLTSGSYKVCGFVGNNTFGGTTVNVLNNYNGSTDAWLSAAAVITSTGINNFDVRKTSGTFQLTSVVTDEFAGTNTFSSVKVVGYISGGGTVESAIKTSDNNSTASSFTFSGSDMTAFSGINLTKFRLVFVNATGSNPSYMTLKSFDATPTPSNTTPSISNLNGDNVAWPGVGNTVVLDSGTNATVGDTEFAALNGGNGNWSGGSLSVQRSGTAISADTFGFNTSGASFSVSGGNLQSGGLTFATFTNSGGVLTITATSSGTTATTALMTDVIRRITYRNDTPSGDATVRFTLSDGSLTATADVTVTSDSIYVTNTTDTASIDITNGVSFSEAIGIAAADVTGNQTIVFSSSMASTALTINSVSIGESLTFDMDSASGMSLTSGTITINNGTSTFTNGAGDTATISSAIGGSGALTKAGAGGLTLSGTGSYTGTTSISAGTLTVSGGNAISNSGAVTVASGATFALSSAESIGNLSGAGSITLGSNTLTTTITADTTFSGGISGTGGLTATQSGAATFALTLSGTNTYTGNTTTANFGWLKLDGDASVSSSSSLRFNGSSIITLLSDQTVGSVNSLTSTATLNLGGFTLSTGGDNTSTSVAGVIAGTGSIIKQGSGSMSLDGSNTYSGTTTVSSGTLSVTSDSNLGSGTLVLGVGSTLDVTGATTIDNGISLSGSATVSNASAATLSGTISGANNLTKSGSGTLTLSGTNSYLGTTVGSGALSITGDGNLGSGTVTLASGTTLTVTGAANIDNAIALSGNATINHVPSVTLSGVISGANTLTKTGLGNLTLSGTNSYGGTTVSTGTLSISSDGNLGSGTLTLGSNASFALTGATTVDNDITLAGNVIINTSADATLSGAISGSFILDKVGSSGLTLSGTNSHGNTNVNSGSLSISSDANLGSGAVNLSNGTTFYVTGATNIDNSIAISGSATLNNSAAVTVSGVVSGGSLIKAGSSALTLSATNTYTGTTTVSAGSLIVTGATAGDTSVASGAALAGTGTLGGAVSVQGGATLSPGVSGINGGAGVLSISGNLAIASGGTLAIDINGAVVGTNYDQLGVAGTVDVSGATLSATHNYTAGAADTYQIIANDGADAVTGNFSGLAEGATLTAGGNSTILTASYAGGTGNDFTLTAPSNPVINSVSASTANGSYKVGDSIDITVTFDTAVDVDTGGGSPTLLLETGATDRLAAYLSGSASTTLTFRYTVQAGDESADLDYVGTNSLSLNGATIRDSLLQDAVLTLASPGAANSLGANKTLVIDGIVPNAPSTPDLDSLSDFGISNTDDLTNDTTPTFTGTAEVGSTVTLYDTDGTTVLGTGTATGGNWSITTGVLSEGARSITAKASDAAGNVSTASSAISVTIDTTAPAKPTMPDLAAASDAGLSNTDNITNLTSLTLQGAAGSVEANVSVHARSDVDGGLTNTTANADGSWSLAVTGLIESTHQLTIRVTDTAGNQSVYSDPLSVVIDTTAPALTGVSVDQASVLALNQTAVSFTSAGAEVGSLANYSITSSNGGTAVTASGATVASANQQFSGINVSGLNDGTLTVSLTAYDLAGNASATRTNTVTKDATPPSATILVATTALIEGDTSAVTITFNEPVSGFTNSALTIENATLSSVSSSDGGMTWTATLTAATGVNDSTNVITLNNAGVVDAAGNPGTGTSISNNYAVNESNTAPTITGTPSTSVAQDAAYSFIPTGADVDAGTTLSYGIANKPTWANFSTSTGALTGTPTNADVGTTSGIVISVSDGSLSASLPAFNLTVVNVNDAPVISGTPSTSVDQDVAYSFVPTATDPDLGDTLTFSIVNKPTWASFNTATGALTGVPAFADVGVYSGIVISVSDGQLSAAVPAFAVRVVEGDNPDAPQLTAPADITVNATALYTPVSLAKLLGLADNASQAQIDQALAALASDRADGNACCSTRPDGLNANNRLLFAPGRHEIRWATTNKLNLTDEAVQVINVKPLVSFSKPQTAIRDSQVEFRILLNGRSPEYPFEVAYGIDSSSTATSSEHNLVAGIAVFTENNPLEVKIPVTINAGGANDSQLVVNFTDNQLNKGAANTHSISIRGGNVPPVVRLVMTQNGVPTTLITAQDGQVSVRAEVADLNPGDTHSFDWSSTQGLADMDNDPVNDTRVFDPSALVQGAYQISVSVQDSAAGQSQANLNFKLVASKPVLSADLDTDGDGISDLDEGFNDSDQNGIPDYLDNMPGTNVLPQVGVITDAYLIECDPGVRCGLGLFALKGNSGGVQILDAEMGTLVDVTPDGSFTPVGGIFDFVINDLPIPGQTVRIVIPQQAPIPANATYRKYQKGQWVSFVQNTNNTLHSAAGDPGYCPPPGSGDWQPGLTAGHLCVQLGVEDGGPNDDDGLVNSSVADPGAVSAAVPVVEPVQPVDIKTKGKGGGSLDLWVIALLLGVAVMMRKQNRVGLTVVVLAAGISTNTQANQWLDDSYLQLDVYQVNGSLSKAGLQGSLTDQGFDLGVTRFDDSRTAWSFSVGYEWNELTYSRVGYLDLGEVSVDLQVAGDTDLVALESALEQNYPITASGFTLSQGLQMQLHPSLSLSTELGVFIWDADISVVEDRISLSYDTELDLMFGVRLDYQVAPQMTIGLSGQEIRFDHQDLKLLGISGRYQF